MHFYFWNPLGPRKRTRLSGACMENMASSLLTLSKPDQLARTYLETFTGDDSDGLYTRFVRAMPEMVGLAQR